MDAPLTHITLGTILKFVGIAVLAGLLLFYVHFQARNFINGPMITLEDTHGILHHDRTIPLTGCAHNIVKLTLNGREIHTNEEGNFTEMLVLEDGYTVMTLEAHDRFGRTTSLTREYVYRAESV